jgi:probable HAF family extracellular repeat protein
MEKGTSTMMAKANLVRTLVVLPVMLVAVGVALFGVGLRTAQPQDPQAADTQTTITNIQVQDLGTLGGGGSEATAINDSGQVVGWSWTANDSEQHAFLYDSTNGMTDLHTLGGNYSEATDINNSGQVVGSSYNSSERRAFLYDSTNGMQDLNDLISADSNLPAPLERAWAINRDGKITAQWAWGAYLLTPATPATYEVQSFGTLGLTNDFTFISATDKNASGQVIGTEGWDFTENGSPRTWHGFLYDSTNGMQDLGSYRSPTSINNYGKVVGYSSVTEHYASSSHAFLYDSATQEMQDLGTVEGYNSSRATGINDSGNVVGYLCNIYYGYCDGSSHAFLKEGGQPMIDLNTLLPADSGWTITSASAINRDSKIAATGYKDGGRAHALLLTPTSSDTPPPDDTTAPDTTITSGPNGLINNTSPTFTFSGSDNVTTTANLKYQYRLDSGGWSAASTSTTANLTGLSEGAHLFEVRAVDEAGNVDGSQAQRSFTVDTTQPMVKTTTPSGAKPVGRGTDLTATFSEKMETSTVNTTTFKLYKVNTDGTQTQITDVEVSLSSDGLTATLNPFGAKTTLLASSTKYKGVITTGTKDLAGNSLAQQKSWTFTTKS